MVETITPAVCGSRRRQIAALAFFAAGALVAAGALGALLGLAGSAVGRGVALALAIALATLGALREAGLLRLPLPQSRRQVPERWRVELPLPVWASGYGGGLGLGFLTYQPVATFWVACAAALALGRPLGGALAFALYGLGRALVLLLPARRGSDPVEIVERLAGRRRTLLRANAVALAACALLLAAAPVAEADVMPLGGGSQLDPSYSGGAFAYTQRGAAGTAVVVRPASGPVLRYDGAETPSVDGERLAYADAQGIRIVRWPTGEQIARVAGKLSKPALLWPWLAYRQVYAAGASSLKLRDLRNGTTRRITLVGKEVAIGRPSIGAGRVAWHVEGAFGSRLVLYGIATGKAAVLDRSKIALLSNPSLSSTHLLWIRQVQGSSSIFVRRLDGTRVRLLGKTSSQQWLYWSTDLYGRTAFVTRWHLSTGVARILRIRF